MSTLADLALFTVLFTDGQRAGLRELRAAWRLSGRALLFGMPLTMVGIALLAHLVAGLGWLTSLLVGAVLSPTDPVFAAAIVTRTGRGRADRAPPPLGAAMSILDGRTEAACGAVTASGGGRAPVGADARSAGGGRTDGMLAVRGRTPALVLVPSLVRAAYGVALLVKPGVLVSATGAAPTTRLTMVARLLGVRHIAQSAALLARPDQRALILGTATDAAHAASDVLFAVTGLAPRAARADAVVAAAFAILTGTAARRAQHGAQRNSGSRSERV